MHIVGKGECPFDPDEEPVNLNDVNTMQIIRVASENLFSAVLLFTIAFIGNADDEYVTSIHDQLVKINAEAISGVVGLSPKEMLQRMQLSLHKQR